jgi:hypothetical protein
VLGLRATMNNPHPSKGADLRGAARLATDATAVARCYALAASLGAQGGELKERLLGDGLVPLASALGQHADAARALAFPAERQWVGYGMSHLDLLSRPEVYARLKEWLA